MPDRYGLLITVGGVGGDFSQTAPIYIYIYISAVKKGTDIW